MKYLVNGKLIDIEEDQKEIIGMKGDKHTKLVQGIKGWNFQGDDENLTSHTTKGEAINQALENGYSVGVDSEQIS